MKNNSTVKTLFCWVLCISVYGTIQGQNLSLHSPDDKILMEVATDDIISWSIHFENELVFEKIEISMEMNGNRSLGIRPKVKRSSTRPQQVIIRPVIPYKDAEIKSAFNELTIEFRGEYKLIFRAYNDGVAYRFIDLSNKTQQVINERMELKFSKGASTYFPKEESMYSHNERTYLHVPISDLKKNDFCSLPVLFEQKKLKVLFTEAALHNYPGMFLKKNELGNLEADFPNYVLEARANEQDSPDRNQIIAKEATYIARVNGGRDYPWRVFMISDDDKTFVESNLVTELSGQSKLKNSSWIKPGQVAWDWYNANNIYGVDFEAGINTETYKYYIDFAAENSIEYVILDEGWTKSTTEIMEPNPDIDLAELINYGRERNVGIILWVLWKPLDENMDEILALYSGWGAKGIKVDFMQRSDQYMVTSYETIAEKAAELKLLVDYHGAFKPAGIERVWPNVINYEGVKGNENNKWSADITPEHNVTIPFIRMAAGPLDFTPGAMANAHAKNYAISFQRPMALGTRCHQLAMYVVYEAPLQMLCESPTRYKKEQESVDFISSIPTIWDETLVIEAAVSDYILIARRKGDNWFIGGMTDNTPRNFELNLDFLAQGKYTMELMRDGKNAHNQAEDYKREVMEVNSTSMIPIQMVGGGGWAAKIYKDQ
ncbi:glycoside hydrolase family 97 protein [Lutimonas sp.]|uniref:glycoside hydrolase family 97 protein n=1 Tax=Lutimonas sp. TaxID=1872403 RepID=UPI003D9B76C5